MHAGQFTTLERVVEHYMRAPAAAVGHSEITTPAKRSASHIKIDLGTADIEDLVSFLEAVNGPVSQSRE
jgi:cytochrome c peroxidase